MAEIIAPQKAADVNFSLAPAYNAIGSLSLLDMAEDFSGLGEWVYRTAAAMSPEQSRTNRLVLHDAYVHLADAVWPSFQIWLDAVASRNATAMRDRALQAWVAEVGVNSPGELPTPAELLSDRGAYLSVVESHLRAAGKPYDRQFWEEMHNLLNDPPVRQKLIVAHLSEMWEELLASEWEGNVATLEGSIAAFRSLDFTGLTAAEALSKVVLRAQIPQESMDWLARLERIHFIPSAHTGPYLVHLRSLDSTTARFLYGARVPEGAPARAPALSRSELLMRLNALANDTRLRILELLAQAGELSTPDVIPQLELSQSAASRHLEHLTATGYLNSRRNQSTNRYRLNPDRIEYTFDDLKEFCRSK